jgi:hypothetical protein
MHVYVRPGSEQSSPGRRSPQRCLAAREGEQPVTSRRLVRVAAALLDTAISLGFWLSGWVHAGSCAAVAQTSPGTAASSIPTVRELDVRGTFDQRGPLAPLAHAPSSPAAQGASANTWTPVAQDGSRSSSSRSEQIPLSVGAVEALRSALQHGVFLTRGGRLGRRSLNPHLSLDGGVA